MNQVNYQKELDCILNQIRSRLEEGERQGQKPAAPPTLFLHSCCAPCSSYVLEYLRQYFAITLFFYNPNITEAEEYARRVKEQKELIRVFNSRVQGERSYPIRVVEGAYRPEDFLELTAGMEDIPEGGQRCSRCFVMRLEETAARAAEGRYDYFATTLTISPLKDAHRLNRIGEVMGEKYGVSWLFSDFKKKNGYKRSVELSRELGLYRQDYCGCEYSKREARRRREQESQKREPEEGTRKKNREDK